MKNIIEITSENLKKAVDLFKNTVDVSCLDYKDFYGVMALLMETGIPMAKTNIIGADKLVPRELGAEMPCEMNTFGIEYKLLKTSMM